MKNSEEERDSVDSLLELSRCFWKSKVLLAANELDVFTELSGSSKNVKDLSRIIEAEPRALEILLNALAALGIIKKDGDSFSNTNLSNKYLSKDSPEYIGYALRHYNYCWASWSELENTIREGQPSKLLEQEALKNNEKRAKDFTLKMDYTGRKMIPQIDEKVDLRGINSMLDLGGGSGCYSIYLVKKYPKLRSTIFELPAVAKFAKENVQKKGLGDRINIIPGDFFKDSISGKYDMVLISFVLHALSPKGIYNIFSKMHKVLSRKGKLIIQEYLAERNIADSINKSLFSTLMLLNNKGKVYKYNEIRNLLRKANYRIVKKIQLKEESIFIKGRSPFLLVAKKEEEYET